jgi:two-component system, sensor histidine kinase
MTSTDARAKILIVDDQPENLVALDALLSGLGQEILQANNGREALKLLLNEEVALILLDIQMKDMDGFETANLIRQREVSKHTPIIFLTAMYTEDVYESEAYSLGAVDFITKPFAAHVLLSKVHFFVDLFKKNQRIQKQAQVIRDIEERRLIEVKERLEAEKQLIEVELARKEKETELLEERSNQLQKADRLKDEFLANMSHEIRTPMNAVIGFSELLLGTSLDNEQSEFAERIKESAQGLLILINDILDLSKIAAGKLDLEPVNFELAPLIEGTAAILSESARDKKLSLMTYIDPELPRSVVGDPGRLRQVLLNLTGNAIKFTEQGEVVVRATMVPKTAEDHATTDGGNQNSPDEIRVAFTITDTGIGLSESEIARLFRPFTQADGSTTRRFGGTGLGLSISKRLSELMGGEIGVTSSPGKGATFWFTITLTLSEESRQRLHDVPESAQDTIKFAPAGTTILLAEDNAVNQMVTQLQLKKLGYDCSVVSTGREAVQALEQKSYALVLMDCQMPDMDGLEATKAIRKAEAHTGRHIPIIGLTAHAMGGDREKCIACGMDEYLSKPASIDQLSTSLKKWITKTENQNQLTQSTDY